MYVMNGVLVTLNNTTQLYYTNETLKPASSVGNLKIPNFNLGIQPMVVNEVTFIQAHRLNWNDMNDYRSLNELLAT